MITNTCKKCQTQWQSTSRATLCRRCWLDEKRKPMPVCQGEGCTTILSTRRSTYCIPCGAKARSKPMPLCKKCDEPVGDRQSTLCGECWKIKVTKVPHTCKCGARLRLRTVKQCRDCWLKSVGKNLPKNGPPCTNCETPTQRSKSGLCRRCYGIEHAPKPSCLDCDEPSYSSRQRCRTHHVAYLAAQRAKPLCERCHKPVATVNTKLCQACVSADAAAKKAAHICKRCDTPLSAPDATYCTPCYREREKELAAARVCWCGKKAKAQNLCPNHYRQLIRKDMRGRRQWGPREQIKVMPCALCGYSKMRSEPHRIIPASQGGRYAVGNMVPLCARCHDEVEAGLTPCPPATTSEELASPVMLVTD